MADRNMPVPYEGNEKYIFISYSHKDMDRVMPVVSRLMQDGYRVWYDDGISPGTEWPEVIAQHLNNCELFVAFLSNSYMDSFNCKREIDFAVRKRKSFLVVFLEETELSLGVEMQISTVQSVDYYKTSEETFFEKFGQFEIVQKSDCRFPMDNPAPVSPEVPANPATPATPEVSVNSATAVNPVPAAEAAVPLAQVIPAAQPAVSATPEMAAKSDVPAKTGKKRFFIPAIICALAILGVAGAVFGIVYSKNHKKSDKKFNKNLIELSEVTVTDKVLKRELKGREVRKIKIENCELAIKNKDVWGEILNENVYEITITGCEMKDEDADAILENAPGLKTLDFSNNQIESLSFANNPKLENANLSANLIDHIDKTNLDNLKMINLDENWLSSLDFLETAVHLTTLRANENRLESIDALKSCAMLATVCLADNSITDVSALSSSLDTIRDLDLGDNKLKTIDVLWPMPELRKLRVDNNELTSLYLTDSLKLSYLSARSNKLDSLSGDFEELTYIDMANNCLSGDYYFFHSPKLKNAFFENNHITELFFYGDKYYSGNIIAYNNPLVKLDVGSEDTSYVIYVSYNEELDSFFGTKDAGHLYLLNCPYDLRVQYEKVWSTYNVTFPEEGEMAEKTEELRKPF